MQLERPLRDDELVAARELVARRAQREPLQYVLGEWGFRRLTLAVDRRALIPRPETEIVVERCLALLDGASAPAVLDVGTGSGAIALAIADEHPGGTRDRDRRLGGGARARPRERRCAPASPSSCNRTTCSTGSRRGRGTSSSRTLRTSASTSGKCSHPRWSSSSRPTALFESGHTEAVAAAAVDVLAPGRCTRARGGGRASTRDDRAARIARVPRRSRDRRPDGARSRRRGTPVTERRRCARSRPSAQVSSS